MSAEQDNPKTAEEIVAEATEQLNVANEAEQTSVDGKLVEPETTDEEVPSAEAMATMKDELLRTKAEMQNVRRRSDAEVDKARKFAVERFAKELLPVADNLERSLQAASDSDDAKALVEGVELTLKSLHDTFAKFNLEVIDPVGEPFDPEFHQAISMVPAPDAEPNSVIDVVQKGYQLNGRVVRAAMVVVAKA